MTWVTWRRFLLGAGLLTMIGMVAPVTRPAVVLVTGWSAVGLILAFARRNRETASRPWVLIAIGGGLGVLGGTVGGAQELLTGRVPVFPGVAELLYGLGYAGLILGVEALRRARTDAPDSEGLLDGAVVATTGSMVIWATVMLPALRDPSIASDVLVTNVIFSILSTVAVAVTVRLAIGPGARAPSYYMLAGAVATFFVADLLGTLHSVGKVADHGPVLGPIVFTLAGAAALHPSMPLLTERVANPPTVVGWRRFILLILALLGGPVLLVAKVATGSTDDLVPIALGSALLSVLTLGRLSLLLRASSEQARTEQSLSQASADLLAATDRRELGEAAIRSVHRLIGRWSVVQVQMLTRDSDPALDPREVSHPAHAAALSTFRTGLPGTGQNRGSLVAITREPLPPPARRALTSLAANVSLALESAELTEALHRVRNERRFRALVERSSDIVIVIDRSSLIGFVSPACEHLLGWTEAEVVGTHPMGYIHEADRSLVEPLFRCGEPGPRQALEVRLAHRDGTARWFEIVARDLQSDPEIEGIVLNCREVTDRKDAELRVFRSEARFRALVQNVGDVVAVIDDDGLFTYVSPAVTPLLGYTPDELIGRPAAETIDPARRGEIIDPVKRTLRLTRSGPMSVESRAVTASGELRILDVTVTDLRHDPAVRGVVLNARDVTLRKQLENTLRHQAQHDSLTGLANRTRFTELVNDAARISGAACCVLFIDLDDFKTVNDSLGHAVGDELLVAVARRLAATLAAEATPARLGGDEFAVLVEPGADHLGPVGVALRLLHAMRTPFDIDGWEIVVTASIGIAAIQPDAPTAEVVLRNADMAMYLAKERGKDRVELFEEAMHTTAFERLEVKADLARAITSGQLVLDYQPIVSLETGRITGAEALVRWNHPRRGRIPPGEFIGIAEDTGLVVQLGRWVLQEACQQLRSWQLGLPADAALSLSVNLSVRQLEQPTIVTELAEVIAQFGLDPSTLTLEITETVVIDHVETDRGRLQDLKDIGVQIALDDFGTGYSSLRYVDDLPVDVIKIDRSFVAGIDQAGGATPVLQSIVELGRRLGVHTVAEGIETMDQLVALRSIGCDLGQGYHFSRPVSALSFIKLLEANLAPDGHFATGIKQLPDPSEDHER